MTTEPDRAQVLKMIETGQVNPTDGARLLGALSQSAPAADVSDRWLRLRITDLITQRPKVSVNLPMTWVTLGLKLGSHYKPELAQIDVNEIIESVRRGAEGRLVEVENVEDGERIEVFVD